MIDPISSSAASLGSGIARDPGRPANIQEAAQKFEALLMAQMLRGAREESTEDLGAGASLMEMAEGVFAGAGDGRGARAAWGCPSREILAAWGCRAWDTGA